MKSRHKIVPAVLGGIIALFSLDAERAAAQQSPAATVSPTPADGTFFGQRTTGAAPGNNAAATPLPSLGAATPHSAVEIGNFTGGKPTAAVNNGANATPAPSAAVPSPGAAMTPVGKWKWHSGASHQLTDKGAILEGTRVVGQWRWLDKIKGQIQVQWTSGPRRAPMNYMLSPRGNHLVGTSPESGKEHSEDRAE